MTDPSSAVPDDREARVQSVLDAYLAECQAGRPPDRAALLAAHPDLAEALVRRLHVLDLMAEAARGGPDRARRLNCPHCGNRIQLVEPVAPAELTCENCGSSFRLEARATTTYHGADWPAAIGKFQIVRPLGQGTFGTVYLARDAELDRLVALKVPRAGAFADPQDKERFMREARAAAGLKHPGIVEVHEIGHDAGMPFIVSAFVDGVTLADRLTAGRPSYRESATLVAQAAEALDYSHSHKIIHRDIKPSNLLLDAAGTPYLTDFGLARRDEGEITVTLDGQILGTPAYMSPEQAAGDHARVDARSDVYSLGVVFYELLTGELPFRGNKPMLLHQVLHDEPKPLRSLSDRIPRDLQTICLKAMAKSPARRYATAAEFAADLRRYLRGEPILGRPVGNVERLWHWARRNPAPTAALSAVALFLIAIAATAVGWSLRERAFAEEIAERGKATRKALEESRTNFRRTQYLAAERVLEIGRRSPWNDHEADVRLLWLAKACELAEKAEDLPLRRVAQLEFVRRWVDLDPRIGNPLPDVDGWLSAPTFAESGELFCTRENKGFVVREAKTGRIARPPVVFSQGDPKNLLWMADPHCEFSSDGEWLATVSGRIGKISGQIFAGELKTWKSRLAGEALQTIQIPPWLSALAIAPDGKRLVAVDKEGLLIIDFGARGPTVNKVKVRPPELLNESLPRMLLVSPSAVLLTDPAPSAWLVGTETGTAKRLGNMAWSNSSVVLFREEGGQVGALDAMSGTLLPLEQAPRANGIFHWASAGAPLADRDTWRHVTDLEFDTQWHAAESGGGLHLTTVREIRLIHLSLPPEPLSTRLLTLVAEVLSRHTLSDLEIPRNLEEAAWQEKRRQLAALRPPVPFQAAAADENEWLRRELAEEHDPAKMLILINRLLAVEPSGALLAQRSQCYVSLKDYERALADWLEARKLKGGEFPDSFPVGLQSEAELSWLHKVMKAMPGDDWRIPASLSQYLRFHLDFDAATAMLLKAWTLDRQACQDYLRSSYFNHGMVLNNNPHDDIRFLEKLVERAPHELFFQGMLEMFRAKKEGRTPSLVGYRQYLDDDARGWLRRFSEVSDYFDLLLLHNQPAEYRAACKQLWEAAATAKLEERALYDVAALLTHGPQALDNLQPPMDRMQKLLAQTPDEDRVGRRMLLTVLGALHYRSGRFKEADDFLSQAAEADESAPPIDHLLFAAMTAFKLGKAPLAGRVLTTAKQEIEKRSGPRRSRTHPPGCSSRKRSSF